LIEERDSLEVFCSRSTRHQRKDLDVAGLLWTTHIQQRLETYDVVLGKAYCEQNAEAPPSVQAPITLSPPYRPNRHPALFIQALSLLTTETTFRATAVPTILGLGAYLWEGRYPDQACLLAARGCMLIGNGEVPCAHPPAFPSPRPQSPPPWASPCATPYVITQSETKQVPVRPIGTACATRPLKEQDDCVKSFGDLHKSVALLGIDKMKNRRCWQPTPAIQLLPINLFPKP
jgi:hypothetical protein